MRQEFCFREELHRVRIERAKRLLSDSDHKMETLASLCGYQSAKTVCIAFKRATPRPGSANPF